MILAITPEEGRLILTHLRPYVRWAGLEKQTILEGLAAKLSEGSITVLNRDEIDVIMDRIAYTSADTLDDMVAIATLRQKMTMAAWHTEKAKILSEGRKAYE